MPLLNPDCQFNYRGNFSFRERLGCFNFRVWPNLTNTLARRELLAHFFQRVIDTDAEAHPQDTLFTRCQRGQNAGCGITQIGLNGRINRQMAFLSSMKSPSWLSSSSPIGVSREIGSLAIFKTLRTLSSGMESFSDNFPASATAKLMQHLPRCAHQLVNRLNHMHRNTNGARLVGD